MRIYCIAQGTLLTALWWPKWEGNPKKRGYMYTYSWCTLLYRKNEHNIVKQLYSNKNFKKRLLTRILQKYIQIKEAKQVKEKFTKDIWRQLSQETQIVNKYIKRHKKINQCMSLSFFTYVTGILSKENTIKSSLVSKACETGPVV